MFTVAPSDM
jgi:hypothetical protein